MKKKTNTIYTLISTEKVSASVTTHTLKLLGNDCMQHGLKIIKEFFYELGFEDGYLEGFLNGFKNGERQGIVKGTVGTAIVSGIVAKTYCSSLKKKHEAEACDEKKKEKRVIIVKKKLEANVPDNQVIITV